MPVDKSEFLKLYHEGKQDVEIARLLNCSREYIRKVRNSYNLPVHPRPKKIDRLSSTERAEIEQKILALIPLDQIAAEYDLSADMIYAGFPEVVRDLPARRREARLKIINGYWMGKKVGMLTIKAVQQNEDTSEYWVEARCSCGKGKMIALNNLRSGRVFSCSKGGCMTQAKANALAYRSLLQEILAGEPRDPQSGRISYTASDH